MTFLPFCFLQAGPPAGSKVFAELARRTHRRRPCQHAASAAHRIRRECVRFGSATCSPHERLVRRSSKSDPPTHEASAGWHLSPPKLQRRRKAEATCGAATNAALTLVEPQHTQPSSCVGHRCAEPPRMKLRQKRVSFFFGDRNQHRPHPESLTQYSYRWLRPLRGGGKAGERLQSGTKPRCWRWFSRSP